MLFANFQEAATEEKEEEAEAEEEKQKKKQQKKTQTTKKKKAKSKVFSNSAIYINLFKKLKAVITTLTLCQECVQETVMHCVNHLP